MILTLVGIRFRITEMIRLAKEADWLMVEQDLKPDPLEQVASRLWSGNSLDMYSAEKVTTQTDRQTGVLWADTTAATNGDATKLHKAANGAH